VNRSRSALKPILALATGLLTLGLFGGVAASAAWAPRPEVRAEPSVDAPQTRTEVVPASRRGPQTARREPTEPAPRTALLAHIPHDLKITSRAGGGKVVGTMPGGSRFFDEPLRAWVLKRSEDGRFGKVTLPYSGSRATGWIRIAGLELSRTPYRVKADLSRHSITVMRKDEVIMRFEAATGAPGSPTPVGRYFVTDLVAIPPGGSFGSFAFGLSGIQTNLPTGWTGGDQLAIHGTQDPSSIGTSASAGCLRVSERSLQKLQRVIELGTPVTIVR
jgi:lipoprotein-anchoring transpeptidase ErfK/SrfK